MRVISQHESTFVSGGDNPGMGPYTPPLDSSTATGERYAELQWALISSIPFSGVVGKLFSMGESTVKDFYKSEYISGTQAYNLQNGYNASGSTYLGNLSTATPIDTGNMSFSELCGCTLDQAAEAYFDGDFGGGFYESGST